MTPAIGAVTVYVCKLSFDSIVASAALARTLSPSCALTLRMTPGNRAVTSRTRLTSGAIAPYSSSVSSMTPGPATAVSMPAAAATSLAIDVRPSYDSYSHACCAPRIGRLDANVERVRLVHFLIAAQKLARRRKTDAIHFAAEPGKLHGEIHGAGIHGLARGRCPRVEFRRHAALEDRKLDCEVFVSEQAASVRAFFGRDLCFVVVPRPRRGRWSVAAGR